MVSKALRLLRTTVVAMVAAAMLIGIGGLLLAHPAQAATTSWTATTAVNVRSAPNTSSSVLGVLPTGTAIQGGDNQSGWVQVSYKNQTGYVCATYLRQGASSGSTTFATASGTKYATTKVNVRSGASLAAQIVAVVDAGTPIGVTGKTDGDWSEVVYQGSARWMFSQYLADKATTPATPATPASPTPSTDTTALSTQYASARTTSELNIRATGAVTAALLGVVPNAAIVSVTGPTSDSYSEIIYNGQKGWVLTRFLVKVSATAGVTTPAAPATSGTMYTTDAVNVRATSAADGTIVTVAPAGTSVQVTGVVEGDRTQVLWAGAVRWIATQYLSATEPTTATGGVTAALTQSASTVVFGTATLDRTTLWTKQIILNSMKIFPAVKTFYGWRASDPYPDHPSGRAVDQMIPSYRTNADLGYAIAQYYQAHAAEFHINYIIWRQHIWSVSRASEGWRYMADRGGDTANHMDHVHITVNAA